MPRPAVLAVWAVAASAALLVAWRVELGPTLVTLSRRHGVHLSDVLATTACIVAAAAATWRLERS